LIPQTICTGATIPTVFSLQWGRDNPLHFPVPLPSPSNPKGYDSLLQGWRGSDRRKHLSRADARNSKGTEGGRGREAGACLGATVDVAGVPTAASQPRLRPRRKQGRTSPIGAPTRAGEHDARRRSPPPHLACVAVGELRRVVLHRARELDSAVGHRSLLSSTVSQGREGRKEQGRRARPRAGDEKLTPRRRGIEEARWRREWIGGRGFAVARAWGRPHHGGAEAVDRNHRKGAPGGRRLMLGRSAAVVRREEGVAVTPLVACSICGRSGRLLGRPTEGARRR
jgi:hypothetical protein